MEGSKKEGTIKVFFWIFFDAGHPEMVGCNHGVPRKVQTLNLLTRILSYYRRTVGMAMWGLFQVINVVVLLNVCVALMNNTMIIINEEQCSTILTLIYVQTISQLSEKACMYFHTWDLGCWG